MDKNTIHTFINKAIEKTKSSELNWSTLSTQQDIKPLPGYNLPLSVAARATMTLIRTSSYVAHFKTGQILLLVYASSPTVMHVLTPPEGCILSLRIQDEKSKYAVEVAQSQSNSTEETSLIRLYNLVDKSDSSINLLIDDFLNS